MKRAPSLLQANRALSWRVQTSGPAPCALEPPSARSLRVGAPVRRSGGDPCTKAPHSTAVKGAPAGRRPPLRSGGGGRGGNPGRRGPEGACTRHNGARWLSSLLALAALSLAACLSDADPERVVRGAITDPDGRPVPDAAVAIADRVAITDDQGAFLLDGLPQDATGPVHVAAHGHTAWTLDRRTLDRLQARLRPSGDLQIASNTLLSLTLAFPQPLTEERTLYLAIDATQITPVRLLPGTTSHRLALPITPGARTLGLLAPPERDEQPYLWSPTALLQIPTSGAELTLAPQPIQPETITLQFTHPEPDAYSLAVTCDAPRGGSALIALGATWDRDQARLALAPAAPGSTCQIIATASPQGSGAALVAFTAFAAGAPPAALRLPPLALTEPQADDDARALSWDPIPGADAYDLFLAHRDGDAIAAPFWSATTAQTRLTLPALPPELTARIDRAPQRPLFARVVARFAPGLDLERNWDWSDYYGYTASPWVEVPPALIDHWRTPP